MVAMLCAHCQSERLVKDGFSSRGKQRYRCRSCSRRSSENPTPRGASPEKQAQVLAALGERMSQRAAARSFKMSRDTISALLEKKTL
jgi:transposase-like protein